MAATVACRDAGEDFAIHARSFSGEHFLSLTTGLVPGQECVLFLVGGSDRGTVKLTSPGHTRAGESEIRLPSPRSTL